MKIKLENTTQRILMLHLKGGRIVAIPPRAEAPEGVTIEMSDAQKPAFDVALASPAVLAWVHAGELLVTLETPEPSEPAAT